jgi:hypothetical protein
VFFVAGTTGFLDGEAVQITFARSGDTGAAGAGSGDMVGANNLSEITNPATARSNIGAASAADLTSGLALKVSKTGDAMTGNLTINPGNLSVTGTISSTGNALFGPGGTGSGVASVVAMGGSTGGANTSWGRNGANDFTMGHVNGLIGGAVFDLGLYNWAATTPGFAWSLGRTDNAMTFTRAAGYTENALTYAASVAWDVLVNPVCTLLLAGNATMAAPTNVVTGRVYTIRIQQNAASTVAWTAANFKFAGASVPVITATAGAVDRFTFIGRAGNVLEEIGRAQGIA